VALEFLGEYSNQLTELDLFYCHKMTNLGLGHLALGCPQLRRVTLDGCNRVSSGGLSVLVASCTRLSVLSLTGCNLPADGQLTGLKQVLASRLLEEPCEPHDAHDEIILDEDGILDDEVPEVGDRHGAATTGGDLQSAMTLPTSIHNWEEGVQLGGGQVYLSVAAGL
jgi:hypothetical protein